MINLNSIRFITIIAFFKIAILILFLYLDVTDQITANYMRYLFIILSIAAFTIIVIYLVGILSFLREDNAVLIAFKVFISFELVSFTVSMAVSLFLIPKLQHGYLYMGYYYGLVEIIRFFILLYLSILLTTMQDPILKPSFVFFGVASLAACIFITVIPLYASYMIDSMSVRPPANIMRHIYTYSGMVNILPLIAVIIILNQVQERLNYAEVTPKKDPFLTGYEDNSEEK
jgi:hypothetical protein